MRDTPSVKLNFLYKMLYEVLVLLLPFITSPYVSRVIGAEGLGTYSYSHSVAYYFVLLSMLGHSKYGNRAIARVRDDENQLRHTFSDLLTVHVLISLVFCLVYLGYVLSLKQRLYALIQLAYVLSALFDISWFYFGIEKFKLTVLRSSLVKIINVILVLLLVKQADDLWIYCLIMSGGMLLSQLTLWIPLRRHVRPVRPEIAGMKSHLKPLLLLFIPAIAVSMYKYMDKIMLGWLSSTAQLGFYENAEKVSNIPVTIIGSFGAVMLPKMSNLAARASREESRRYNSLSMQFVLCMAFAFAFGLAAVGTTFAPVFWGGAFRVSGGLMMGLAVTIPFVSFANVIRTQYLLPNQRDKAYLSSVVIGAGMNLAVNAALIPRWGAMGATTGTIAAEVSVCLVQAWVVRRELPLGSYVRSFAFFALAGGVMFAAVYGYGQVAKTCAVTVIVQVLLGGVLYTALALGYLILTKNAPVLTTLSAVRKRLLPGSRDR